MPHAIVEFGIIFQTIADLGGMRVVWKKEAGVESESALLASIMVRGCARAAYNHAAAASPSLQSLQFLRHIQRFVGSLF